MSSLERLQQICSLRSGEDHLTFSVTWEVDDLGNILEQNVNFFKSVIHSVASLTYDEAQVRLRALTSQQWGRESHWSDPYLLHRSGDIEK